MFRLRRQKRLRKKDGQEEYMFLAQLFRSLTRVLQWHGEYVCNLITFDHMYESVIYYIYKVTVNDGYDHCGTIVFTQCSISQVPTSVLTCLPRCSICNSC